MKEILKSTDIQEQIEQNGFFQSPQDFKKWIKEKYGKTSDVNTASLLNRFLA